MSFPTKAILPFALLLITICLLRQNDTSPAQFLRHHALRILGEESIKDVLCKGVTLTIVSSGEKERALNIRSTVSKLRSGNQIMDFIQGSDPRSEFIKEYAKPLVKFTAPWIAMFAVGLLVFIGILINFCCMHCSCCKNINCCKGPKITEKNPSKFWTITSIIFSSAVAATSIAGLIFSAGMLKGGNQTICSVGVLLDHLIEGNQPENWAGLDLIIADLQILFDNFAADSLQLSYPYGSADIAIVNSGYSSVSADVTTMYNDNSGSTVHRADPSIGGTYQPAYIQVNTIFI